MHLLYFHKAERGEWQRKKKKGKCVCFYLFIMNVYMSVRLSGVYERVCSESSFFYGPTSLSPQCQSL